MKPERDDPRTPELDALLGAARRPGVLDPADEERALRAFRLACDEGGVGAAPVRWRRSRDDWRPGGERRWARALKALVAGVAAAAALGGVAVAAGRVRSRRRSGRRAAETGTDRAQGTWRRRGQGW